MKTRFMRDLLRSMGEVPNKEADFIGNCDWCSQPVYSDQPHESGNRGDGVMHTGCDRDDDVDYHSKHEDGLI